MLDVCLGSARRADRARASPFGAYLDGFVAHLHDLGYCQRWVESCVVYTVHLGVWAAANQVSIATLGEEVVDAFAGHLRRCRCPGYHAGPHEDACARTRPFLKYLRAAGIIASRAPKAVARPQVVTEFCEWLRRQRGVRDSTLRCYSHYATRLVGHLGDDASRYQPVALREAMRMVVGHHGIDTTRMVSKVARVYLRYLAVEGRCRPGLDAAILPVPGRGQGSLPSYLPAEALQRVIEACDPTRPVGARDRAILMLLARLGLRAGDVVSMRLCDVDWAGGFLRFVGKGRREVRLPLPQEVGDAILAYLRVRPRVASDHLFLRARAPLRPFSDDSSTVSAIVCRALDRAGIPARTRGANLLRHSVATAMLREGISLPSIGIVLRHRSVETTARYARVDVEMLRAVAQPWPGGASC
jgi:integrase/recombinase XerD